MAVNSSVTADTFEGILEEIKKVINSENEAFSKVFQIAELVNKDRIWNIPVPGVISPDDNVNDIGIAAAGTH